MADDLRSRSWVLRVWPWLLLAEAVVVVAVVMPAVEADHFLGATPERAWQAFAVIAAIDGVLALVGAIVARRRSAGRPGTLAVLGSAIVLALQVLAFTDAALAYRAHGVAMVPTVVILAVCALADLALATALVLDALRARHPE